MQATINLQKKIGAKPDGDFGPMTAKALVRYMGVTPIQGAHFIGQCWHESAGFSIVEEDLNYSERRLLQVFGKYFTTQRKKDLDIANGKRNDKVIASEFAGKPEKIGNVVYAFRMGNGGPESGDGYKNRGRGFIHTTGANNYRKFAVNIGLMDIVEKPDLVASVYPLESAIFFFQKTNLFQIAIDLEQETMDRVSITINGGLHGIEDRITQTKKAYSWIVK